MLTLLMILFLIGAMGRRRWYRPWFGPRAWFGFRPWFGPGMGFGFRPWFGPGMRGPGFGPRPPMGGPRGFGRMF